jgi:hypothetical protein
LAVTDFAPAWADHWLGAPPDHRLRGHLGASRSPFPAGHRARRLTIGYAGTLVHRDRRFPAGHRARRLTIGYAGTLVHRDRRFLPGIERAA